MPSVKLKHGIFYGWWVVIACAAIQFYLGGTFYQGFTAFFNPLAEEFGWSYALVSLATTLRGFESGILAPIIGILVDRLGPRKLLLSGVLIVILGFWIFSRIHTLSSFYVASMLLSLGLSFGGGLVSITAVAHWFNRRRMALAMGILTSGFGASGILMPLVVVLVDSFGWRQASVMFGIGAAVLCLPLALVAKDPPPSEGPSVPKTESSREHAPAALPSTVRQALKTRGFWLLSLAIFFSGMAGQAAIVHHIPYLVSIGIPRQTAALLAVVFSVSNVTGRLLFGWLGDMIDRRRGWVIATAILSAGVFIFAMVSNVWLLALSLIAFGIGFGGVVPLRPALQIEFFGMGAFATIQGLLMTFITLGAIVSPLFAGWMFDVAGSYRPAFLVMGALTLPAIPVVLAARRQQNTVATM